MAVLDVERGTVVIRIVYDGPPEAGKTTSLRTLSASLARPMSTPGQAGGDRTLFFDWVEYTGGLFEGNQIRCQIITVPGQTVLAHRRHGLLETADAVIFVSDSAPSAVETTAAYLTDMRATLDALPGPRIGVILQANKRDRPNAVGLPELRAVAPDVAVLESVATEGRGVREAFVFAVRLALDRVRELLRERSLRLGPPDVQSSGDLLTHLERRESEWMLRASRDEEKEVQKKVDAQAEPETPWPPDARVPSGMIWPPIDGRVILHEACAIPFTPRRLPNGDWIGEAGGWRFHSPQQASYVNPELGRRGLIEWARLHTAGQRWLSGPRVVTLAASGEGTWRLWQIVKVESSLRDFLVQGLNDNSPEGLLRRLLDSGRMLMAATEALAFAPCRLPLRVDTIGAAGDTPIYIGFLPDPFLLRAPQPLQAEQRPALLRRELGALAATELRAYTREALPPLGSIARESDPHAVVEAVRDVLRDAGIVD